MNSNKNKITYNPLAKVFNNIMNKFTQSPDVYPIKFYMKGNRLRRRYTYNG